MATLGPHVADYSTLTIKFFDGSVFVTLWGDSPNLPSASQAHYHHLRRLHHTNVIFAVFTLHPLLSTDVKDLLVDLLPPPPSDMLALLRKYISVFHKPHGLPPSRSHDHAIPLLPGVSPMKVRPYRYPFSYKTEIEKIVSDLLQEGLIQHSTSPFSSPVILVKKKDGSWRFCTDYIALNAVTVKDCFLIPTVDELLDELHGAHYFSKLDLRSGYHQLLVKPEDCHKIAFRTHQGHYEWLVMPFDLTNAPTSFQALMNQIFQQFLRKFVLVFFYDILIYSASWFAHLQHVEQVLSLMQEHHLHAKLSKCAFGITQISYLGHLVSSSGVYMDPDKVETVLQWSIPTTLKQLRGFLGLTSYYRRFIKGYATFTALLHELLKKDSFHWSAETEVAFHNLKTIMT